PVKLLRLVQLLLHCIELLHHVLQLLDLFGNGRRVDHDHLGLCRPGATGDDGCQRQSFEHPHICLSLWNTGNHTSGSSPTMARTRSSTSTVAVRPDSTASSSS